MSTRQVSYGLSKYLSSGKEDLFIQTLIKHLPFSTPTVNFPNKDYFLQDKDAGNILVMENPIACNIIIRPGLDIPVGVPVWIFQYSAANVGVLAASGVSLHSPENRYIIGFQYGKVEIMRLRNDEYILTGDLKDASLVNELGQVLTTETGAPLLP